MMSERVERTALGALAIAVLLAAWEVIGRAGVAGMTWPPLSVVLVYLTDPLRLGIFTRALDATLSAFALGYVDGAVLGIGFATLGHLLPKVRRGADRLTATVHAVPAIALAPLFMVLIGRDDTSTAVATINAFFMFYIGTSSGLLSTSPVQRDLMKVLGASRFMSFCRVELPAALPALASAAKLAVPSALIGAIIGEWFGADRGLGVLILTAMQNFQIPLLWSAVLITSAISLGLFGAAGLLERFAGERFR